MSRCASTAPNAAPRLVFGPAALRSARDALTFDPVLLPEWEEQGIALVWRGMLLDVRIDPERLEVQVRGGRPIVTGAAADPRPLAVGARRERKWTRRHEAGPAVTRG